MYLYEVQSQEHNENHFGIPLFVINTLNNILMSCLDFSTLLRIKEASLGIWVQPKCLPGYVVLTDITVGSTEWRDGNNR